MATWAFRLNCYDSARERYTACSAELFGGDFIKRYAETVSLHGQEWLEHFLDRYGIEWTLLQFRIRASLNSHPRKHEP